MYAHFVSLKDEDSTENEISMAYVSKPAGALSVAWGGVVGLRRGCGLRRCCVRLVHAHRTGWRPATSGAVVAVTCRWVLVCGIGEVAACGLMPA